MPEQPFYKICEHCGHYIQTAASGAKSVCTRYPQHMKMEPDDTCGEWVCNRCWIPWDMVIQDPTALTHIHIIDHTKCPQVRFDSLPVDLNDFTEEN